MKLFHASFFRSYRYFIPLLALLLSPEAGAVDILINSGDATVKDDSGAAYDFGGSLHEIKRRRDLTLEVTIRGDLHLAAGDSLRGVGPYPIEILVGNDVTIDPGATVDFSAVGSTPGAGGGGGVSGGKGGRGGNGGQGGLGGFLGIGGLGGAAVPIFQSPVKVTTPGIPAAGGLSGFDGTGGTAGSAGDNGRRGVAGFGARGSGGGTGGSAGAPAAPTHGGGTGGDSGDPANYPPRIWFQGDAIRAFFYGDDFADEDTFRAAFNGGNAEGGSSGLDEPPAASGGGSDGDGGVNSGDVWVLSGGNAGGSGAGGGGGPGGPGGGGGGAGAGGQGEWIEPIPTSTFGIIKGVKSIADLIKHYRERKKDKDQTSTKKFPSIEIGATGGPGGRGGRGGPGGKGGTGGNGGASGAGGGALRLVAGGTIRLDGGFEANGGDGSDGTSGTTESLTPYRVLGRDGAGPLPGLSAGSVGSLALGNTPRAGRGGDGGDGGFGGKGGMGSPGGNGAGGAGGTVILEATRVSGSGSIALLGGNQDDAGTIGGDGRLFIATNQVVSGTPASEFADEAGEFVVSPSAVGSTTLPGPLAPNPYLKGIEGSPLTPTIPGLIGGAEAFGLISDPAAPSDDFEADQFTIILPPPGGGAKESKTLKQWAEDYATVDPDNEQGAVVAAVRLDEAPDLIATEFGMDVDFPGYDWVFVFNPRTSNLVDVRFGFNDVDLPLTPSEVTSKHAATLRQGGYLNDPDFGGGGDLITGEFVAGQFDVFVTLVPEDDAFRGLNLAMSATAVPNGGGDPVVYSKEVEQFANDDLVVITFDPDIPIYEAVWANPTASGNWSTADNWNVTLDGSGDFDVYPNNNTVNAYNVNIGPGLFLDVDQDVSVTIDRIDIGNDTRLFVQDGRSLEIEKFYVREEAGVIANNGLIRLLGSTAPTELRFTGDGQVLTGNGLLTTTASSFNEISGDSLTQESDHTILGHGELGANQLEIINLGTILSGPSNSGVPLTIDPAGDGGRSLPGFILEGTDAKLQVSGWPYAAADLSSELILKDGYFRIDPASSFGFESLGEIDAQVLTLDRVRLEREDEAFIDSQPVAGDAIALTADQPERTIRIIGDPVATDDEVVLTRANLRTTGGGSLEIKDVDLRLDGSSIKLQETAMNGYGTLATIDNGGVFGGLLTYDRADLQPGDPFGPLPCDIDQGTLGDVYNDGSISGLGRYYLGYRFPLRLEGENVRFGDVRIDGCYRFDPFLEQEFRLVGGAFYEYIESKDLLAIDCDADSLTLAGVIDHNGLLSCSVTTEVFLDGDVDLIGEGGWRFPRNFSDRDHLTRIKGVTDLPVDDTETLTIGAGQVMHDPGFDSDGLFIENDGLLLRASINYNGSSIPDDRDAQGYDAAVEAVKAQPLMLNRGVVQPDGVFGGGTIDNRAGVIALGGDSDGQFELIDTSMENLRVEGGIVSVGLHYRNVDPQFLESSPTFLKATNVDFNDVRFESELFAPIGAPRFFDEFIGGQDGEFDVSLGIFDVTTGLAGIRLENTTLATHMKTGRVAVAGKLVIEEGVAVSIGSLNLIDDDYEIEFPDEADYDSPDDPRSSLTLRGLGGNPGSIFKVPADLDFYGVGSLGQDQVVLDLADGALLKPSPDFESQVTILDPPGDKNASSPGLVNRGTITAYDLLTYVEELVSGGTTITDYETENNLILRGGYYDNEDGVIEFGSAQPNQINDALIVGGILRGRLPGTVVNITNSTLRNVQVENIVFVGDYTVEDGRYLNDDADSESVSGDVTFVGTSTFERSESWTSNTGYDFVFDEDFGFGVSSADLVSIASGARVQFAGTPPNPIELRNLRNAGLIESAHAFEITSPTFLGSQSFAADEKIFFDPQTVSLASLEELGELGAGETLVPESNGNVENSGTIHSSSTIRIDSTALDNRGGEITADVSILVVDSIIDNEGGLITTPSPDDTPPRVVELYSSVINAGTVSTDRPNGDAAGTIRLLGEHPDGPGFGGENRTALVDVSLMTDSLAIDDGATLWCLGEVTVPSTISAAGALRITGSLDAGSIEEGDWDLEMDGGTLLAPATTIGTVSGSGTVDDLSLNSGSRIQPVLRSVSDYDHIDVTTSFYTEAVVEPVLEDGFQPCSSDVFTILTAPSSIFDAEGMSGSQVNAVNGGSFTVYYGDEYMTSGGEFLDNPYDPASIVLADYRGPSTVHYVAQGASGLGTGESWDDAFPDLQSAIAIAQPGEEIWVADGDYSPGAARGDSFELKAGVRMYGGFAAGGDCWANRDSNPETNGTVLTGDINGDGMLSGNNYHVIDAMNSSADSLLDGFTIAGGNSDEASGINSIGGGIILGNRSPSLSNVRFLENRARFGGALHTNNGSELLMHLDFDEDPASDNTVLADSSGNGNSATLDNNNGTLNKSVPGQIGNALNFDGGNDRVDATAFDIDNTFTIALWIDPNSTANNQAFIGKHTASGVNQVLFGYYINGYHLNIRGVSYTETDSLDQNWQHLVVVCTDVGSSTDVTVYKNGAVLFTTNLATEVGNVAGGKGWTIGQDWDSSTARTDHFNGVIDEVSVWNGAISAADVESLYQLQRADFVDSNIGAAKLANVSFIGNVADIAGGSGGAIYLTNLSDLSFTNCLFADNASVLGGAMRGFNSDPEFINCTFANNDSPTGSAIYGDGGTDPLMKNCIVWGNTGGVSIDVDSLDAGSLNNLIEGGFAPLPGAVVSTDDPQFVAVDDYRLMPGSPALELGDNASNGTELDLAGNARLQGLAIDLGAYEGALVNFATVNPVLDPLLDANGNGRSNFEDYAAGFDPTADFDVTQHAASLLISDGSWFFTHPVRRTGEDVGFIYESSSSLTGFTPMIEGVDYVVVGRVPIDGTRDEAVIRLLDEQLGSERKFFRRSFVGTP